MGEKGDKFDYIKPEKQLSDVKYLWTLSYWDHPLAFIGEYNGEKVYGALLFDHQYSIIYDTSTKEYDAFPKDISPYIQEQLDKLGKPLYQIEEDDVDIIEGLCTIYVDKIDDRIMIALYEDLYYAIYRLDDKTTSLLAAQHKNFKKYVCGQPQERWHLYYDTEQGITVEQSENTLLGYCKNICRTDF